MIDVCTLMLAQTMTLTLQACLPPIICKPVIDNDGNTIRQVCRQSFSACPGLAPNMWYECKKPDGSIYTEPYNSEIELK